MSGKTNEEDSKTNSFEHYHQFPKLYEKEQQIKKSVDQICYSNPNCRNTSRTQKPKP